MRKTRFSGQKYCFILDDGNKTLDCGNDRHNPFFVVTMTPDRLFKTEIKQKEREDKQMKEAIKNMEDIEVMEVSEASLLGETAASSGSSSSGSCSCCGSTSCVSCGINGSSVN